jgi:4-amino-4-deoxy-L-arabinose transferase-like glycosyltransferase
MALGAVLLVALCLPHLVGGRWAVDMGWYAGIGRHAFEKGDFWFLRAEGQPYFNKPPLAFWVHGAFISAFGGSSWVVRLPVLLSAMGCVMVLALLVQRLAGARAALAASVIGATTAEIVRLATQAPMDFLHTLLLLLAALGIVVAERRERQRWGGVIASGLACGLALLTKPFFGLGMYIVLAAWLVVIRRARLLPWVALGALIACAAAAPWHVSMLLRYGRAFIDEYLGRQSLARAAGVEVADPWWYYLALVGRSWWPWIACFGAALVALARGKRLSRRSEAVAFALLWSVLWVVALSAFAGKRRPYLIVAYPGMALLAALWLANCAPAWGRRWLRPPLLDGAVALVLLCSIVITAGGWAFWRKPNPPEWAALYAYIREQQVQEIFSGAVHYSDAGMVYAEAGVWPRAVAWGGDDRAAPPIGALVLYSDAPPPAGVAAVFAQGRVALIRWPGGAR